MILGCSGLGLAQEKARNANKDNNINTLFSDWFLGY
jgi:hypothetical protein